LPTYYLTNGWIIVNKIQGNHVRLTRPTLCVLLLLVLPVRMCMCVMLQLKDEVVLLKAAVRSRDADLAAAEDREGGVRADLK
jgi:hypothetical protein